MPSRRKRKTRKKADSTLALYPLLVLSFIIWFIYRSLFRFPVLFDESIGKAIFFGLPVWLYISITGGREILRSLDLHKIKSGLLMGLVIGGLYGFAASLAVVASRGESVAAVPLFVSTSFWWEFFLATLTAFWETLFFFSFVMTGVMLKHRDWSLLNQILLTAFVFLIFHIPNIILRFSGVNILTEIFLLFFFAMGQAFVFAKGRNFYTLVVSHAFWGMVLLVHV